MKLTRVTLPDVSTAQLVHRIGTDAFPVTKLHPTPPGQSISPPDFFRLEALTQVLDNVCSNVPDVLSSLPILTLSRSRVPAFITGSKPRLNKLLYLLVLSSNDNHVVVRVSVFASRLHDPQVVPAGTVNPTSHTFPGSPQSFNRLTHGPVRTADIMSHGQGYKVRLICADVSAVLDGRTLQDGQSLSPFVNTCPGNFLVILRPTRAELSGCRSHFSGKVNSQKRISYFQTFFGKVSESQSIPTVMVRKKSFLPGYLLNIRADRAYPNTALFTICPT